MKARMMGAVALGLLAAACGTDPRERVSGGAAAGAATGAGVGALGGPVGVLAGAGIGAAAGAATGAATTPDQVNLGRPVWDNPDVRLPGDDRGRGRGRGMAHANSADTRNLQQALNNAGYNAGRADGVYGAQTRRAVTAWQRANNMEATGRPNAQMMTALNLTPATASTASSGMRGTTRSADRDRAYQGGGMTGSNATQGSSMGGGMGMTTRPDPASPPSNGRIPTPSNNPMNDPTGGNGALVPGLNNNQSTSQ